MIFFKPCPCCEDEAAQETLCIVAHNIMATDAGTGSLSRLDFDDGEVLWTVDFGVDATTNHRWRACTPAIDGEGNIYCTIDLLGGLSTSPLPTTGNFSGRPSAFIGPSGGLVKLDRDGNELWRVEFDDVHATLSEFPSPSTGNVLGLAIQPSDDSRIWAGSHYTTGQKLIHGFEPDGTPITSYGRSELGLGALVKFTSVQAVAVDGNDDIWFSTIGGQNRLYCLSPAGVLEWEPTPAHGWIPPSPGISPWALDIAIDGSSVAWCTNSNSNTGRRFIRVNSLRPTTADIAVNLTTYHFTPALGHVPVEPRYFAPDPAPVGSSSGGFEIDPAVPSTWNVGSGGVSPLGNRHTQDLLRRTRACCPGSGGMTWFGGQEDFFCTATGPPHAYWSSFVSYGFSLYRTTPTIGYQIIPQINATAIGTPTACFEGIASGSTGHAEINSLSRDLDSAALLAGVTASNYQVARYHESDATPIWKVSLTAGGGTSFNVAYRTAIRTVDVEE